PLHSTLLLLLCLLLDVSTASLLKFFVFIYLECVAASASSTLSLHDALPIFLRCRYLGLHLWGVRAIALRFLGRADDSVYLPLRRSEEHTSELQSRENLVCRLLLEKKKRT